MKYLYSLKVPPQKIPTNYKGKGINITEKPDNTIILIKWRSSVMGQFKTGCSLIEFLKI